MKNSVRWVVVLVCMALFAQIPVFVDQYLMRLEGHLAESYLQINAYTKAALAGNKTLDQYIAKFLEQADADFLAQGRVMRAAVDRNAFLASSCEALQAANPLIRPLVCVRYLDREILADTWNGFTPGLLVDINLAVWAFIGFVIGCLLFYSIVGLFGVLRGH